MPSHNRLPALLLSLTLLAPAAALRAQQPDRFTGHWVGAIRLPGQELGFDVDLARGAGGWTGDISIPAQNLKDLPLTGLAISGDSIRFSIGGIPGDPTFVGALAPDRKTAAGAFSQGGGTFPFTMHGALAPADAAREALRGFDRFVDSAMAAWKVVGLGLGIVVDGQVVYVRGHGFRDLERKLPATERTLFAIGSSSKAFTVYALGTLVDQGKLEWDKPVITYMPEFRLYDPAATLRISPRDLVTHRSGLPRHDLVWYNNFTSTREDLISRIAYLPPNKDLRETFQYNNLMFLTAGVLAGRIMNSSWEDAIRRLVFQPLGMNSSNFSVAESQKTADWSRGYEVRKDTIRAMPFRNIDLIGPAGSINSNVADMVKWIGMHLAGGVVDGKQVIARTTLNDMYAPHMPIGGMPSDKDLGAANYGMGWFLTSYRGHYLVQHGGNIDGFSAMVALMPQDRIGIVVLSNQNGAALPALIRNHAMDRILSLPPRDWNAEALAAAKRAETAGREAEKKKMSVRVTGTQPSHPLAEYAAEYAHPGYGTLTVAPDGDHLVATYHSISTPLEHWHYDVFNGLRNPADPTFEDMKYNFRSNMKGDIDAVAAPFEPSVDPIVFVRQPDKRLVDPAFLQGLTGRYALSNDTANVILQGARLVVVLRGQPPSTLEPDRRTEFNLKGLAGYSVEFVLDAQGAVTELRLKQPSGVFAAKRVAP
jgi:CubicO group peptidase (beta-lactamase class C family)